MLRVTLIPHRPALRAGSPDPQKVFALLKVIPKPEVSQARPQVTLALVFDTSTSMFEFADEARAREMAIGVQRESGLTTDCGLIMTPKGDAYHAYHLPLPTKLDQAIEAGLRLVDDVRLSPQDRIMVVKFDDEAATLLPPTPVAEKQRIRDAIRSLRRYSGGTYMGKGLARVREAMGRLGAAEVKRAVMLTDGHTMDETAAESEAAALGALDVRLIGLGFGTTYNQDLVFRIAALGSGRPHHLLDIANLGAVLADELGISLREVVTDVHGRISLINGVTLDKLSRVYPWIVPIDLAGVPLRLGSMAAGDYTMYILEFTMTGVAYAPGHVCIAEVGLEASAPTLGRREIIPPQELRVEFTTDERATGRVDPEVMGYVQQLNLDTMLERAMGQATVDASRARDTLLIAQGVTRSVGNVGMTRLLTDALEQLNSTGTITPNLGRTIRAGGRTMTVKTGSPQGGTGLTDEEIRRITGV